VAVRVRVCVCVSRSVPLEPGLRLVSVRSFVVQCLIDVCQLER
jgi:hypothetical protein